MAGRSVIPWDKDDIEELRFFKVDILALGLLTAVRKTLALIHDAARQDAVNAFDPIEALAAIPPEDPAVYEAIQRADVLGVFQNRKPRPNVDAATPSTPVFLRLGDRGRHRATGANPGWHGAPLSSSKNWP